MHRRVYAFDLNLNDALDKLWREQRAQGVSWETFTAAKALSRPRTAELFKDHIERLNEAARERFQHLNERGDG